MMTYTPVFTLAVVEGVVIEPEPEVVVCENNFPRP